MPQATLVVGPLVGTNLYEYSAFEDNGKTVPGGISRHVFVAEDFNDEPTKVKVGEAAFNTLRGLGYGAEVTLEVESVGRRKWNLLAVKAAKDPQSSKS